MNLSISALFLALGVVLAVSALAAPAAPRGGGGLRPAELRCEYAVNPLGVDVTAPRLSWTLEAARPELRGLVQTAYQVQVASAPERLVAGKADLWDTGPVTGSETIGIAYAGKALGPGQHVWWRVRSWDGSRRVSAWSAPAEWEMGLLRPGRWQARWIRSDAPPPASDAEAFGDRPAPLFRKEITVAKKLARARAYFCGLGYGELRINGQRVGDHVLDPGWTHYAKRVYYSTYDVTPLLTEGRNALGVMLGNGWWSPGPLPLFGRDLRQVLPTGEPRLILQLQLTYADGTQETVVSDSTWKWAPGPVIRNNVYLGELYDARRELPGWDAPGFDDAAWRTAVPAAEAVGRPEAQPVPPIRVGQALNTVKMTEPKAGVRIYDLGQNFAGWPVLRVKGPAGTRVTLRYGELLYPDGTLNPMTSVASQIKGNRNVAAKGGPATAVQTDAYVLKGEGEETWSPRFTFHGFRYVELTSASGPVEVLGVEGRLLHSDVPSAGEFSCSNPLLNRIQEAVRWTLLSNLFSVQSDCPHREKLGYGGDIVASSEMAIFNFDMARFYAKAVHDLEDAQRPNGGFTETSPYVGIADEGLGGGSGPVAWGTAQPLLLWQLYQYYGDRRLLSEGFEPAKRWMALLQASAKDHLLERCIGDHESLAPKPTPLTTTAFYYYNAWLLSRIAGVLGNIHDAAKYAALAAEIRGAFNRKFLQPGTGKYDAGTQAAQAFALFMDLVPRGEQGEAQELLVSDVMKAHQGHLTTGIFGTKYLLLALTNGGRADVAYTIAGQKTFPGWGFMLENGATTLWEHWAISDNTYSHNHPMFGSVSEWFFKGLGGIQPDEEARGFHRFTVRPHPVGDLTWAKTRYRSVRGPIVSDWKKEGGKLSLTVELPPNTTATVYVPARLGGAVLEGGKPAERAKGVKLLFQAPDSRAYQVGSGKYTFTAPA